MKFDNKTLIIIIVGVAAMYSLHIGEMNVAAVCVGGLIGYLSKDLKEVSQEVIDNINSTLEKEEG